MGGGEGGGGGRGGGGGKYAHMGSKTDELDIAESGSLYCATFLKVGRLCRSRF